MSLWCGNILCNSQSLKASFTDTYTVLVWYLLNHHDDQTTLNKNRLHIFLNINPSRRDFMVVEATRTMCHFPLGWSHFNNKKKRKKIAFRII